MDDRATESEGIGRDLVDGIDCGRGPSAVGSIFAEPVEAQRAAQSTRQETTSPTSSTTHSTIVTTEAADSSEESADREAV